MDVNDVEDIYEFLDSGADGIITDNVSGAKEITEDLKNRPLLDRAVDKILDVLFD